MALHVNGPLHWEQHGKSGPLMVFVHPNPQDHSCWLYQTTHFSTWFRTVAVDLPGYGRSPSASDGLTMPDVAQACWEAVDQVASEPAILAGLSVGSNVVQHMANQRPERTRAVILSGASYRPTKENLLRRAKQYATLGLDFRRQHALENFSAAFAQTPMGQYFADMYAERNGYADVNTIVTMFRALAQPDPEWLQAGVRCPTIILTGSEDNSHPASFDLQRRIDGCELVTLEGAGHACNMEQPWLWDRLALEFLERHGLAPDTASPTGRLPVS